MISQSYSQKSMNSNSNCWSARVYFSWFLRVACGGSTPKENVHSCCMHCSKSNFKPASHQSFSYNATISDLRVQSLTVFPHRTKMGQQLAEASTTLIPKTNVYFFGTCPKHKLRLLSRSMTIVVKGPFLPLH